MSVAKVPGRQWLGLLLPVALVAACSSTPAAPTGAAATASAAAPTTAASEAAADCEGGFPAKDITFIVPYSPGGGFDTWARLVAPYLEKHLAGNPTVLVENKSGAGGLVGVTEAYGSDPDGYTIAITEPGILVTSQIAGTTEIDPAQLRAIGQVAVNPEAVVVRGDAPWSSVDDVVAAAASVPVKMGNGGIAAINVVTFDALDIPWTGVFHDGSSEAILSVVRGDTDIAIFPLGSLLEGIKASDLKPIAVVGTKPTGDAPGAAEVADVPTLDEITNTAGLGAALEQHRIVVAPPGTPDCVVAILSDALQASLTDPEFVTQATAAELIPAPLGSEETQAIITNTVTTLSGYADLIREKLEQ